MNRRFAAAILSVSIAWNHASAVACGVSELFEEALPPPLVVEQTVTNEARSTHVVAVHRLLMLRIVGDSVPLVPCP